MNVIPCLTWVRRGVSKSTPDRVKLDKDELRRIIEETKDKIDEDLEDADEDNDNDVKEDEELEEETKKKSDNSKKLGKRKHDDEEEEAAEGDDIDDITAKYGLDDYDDEDQDKGDFLQGIGHLVYHADDEDDPYITLKGELDSDEEDFEIKATDNIIVAGRAKKEACSLEIHVYNEDLGNLYVHHDLLLSSFPLAVEWLNFDIGEDKPGSFVAVGSMEPTIEIWDLDVVDAVEPVAVLGAKVKKKNKKKGTVGHTDAVLDLSWNSNVRHVLASASADYTCGIWDLSQGKTVTTIKQFKEKVQCIKWHPFELQSLLAGSFDHTVKVFDCRSPNESYKSWNVGGEVERICWDAHSPLNFYATTDKGLVYYIDSRQDKPVFTLSAHNEAVTGICQSSQVPGLLVTTSTDGAFKVWDVQDNKPSSILDRNLKMGQIQSLGGCPEAPFVFAIGGEEDLKVWDIRESAAVRRHFYSRAPPSVTMETVEGAEEQEMAGVTATALETLSIDSKPNKKKKNKNKKKSDGAKVNEDNSVLDELDIDNSLQQNEDKKKKKKKKKKKQEES